MDDLITWLRGVLDDHERERRSELARIHGSHPDAWLARDGFPRGDFTLTDIDAKRRILDGIASRLEYRDETIAWELADAETSYMASDTLRLLALPYADRPGYRQEWKP